MAQPAPPPRTWGGSTLDARRDARRERLLDVGLELLGGPGGAAAVTVRSVCRHAKLTDRYFYESFADRDELLLAVYDRVGDEARGVLARAVAEAVSAGALPETVARAAVPAETVPAETVARAAVPAETVPAEAVARAAVPAETVPAEAVARAVVPAETVPAEAVARAAVAPETVAPEAVARAAVRAFVEMLTADPRKGRVLLLAPITDPGLNERALRLQPAFTELIRLQLAAGTGAPVGEPGAPVPLDQRLTAAALIGALSQLFIRWLDGSLEVTVPELTDYCVRLLVHTVPMAAPPT